MRKTRVIEHCRCYHLISRLAHRAFFLDDDEKTRAVGLLRRVEEFTGVTVLAYAIMANHFHIFIYVPEPEELDDREILRRINALYREASLLQVLGEWTRLKEEETKFLEHARPTKEYVSRFAEYRQSFLRRMDRGDSKVAERILELLAGGPMRSSELRKAVRISSGIHFSRYYLTPLMEKGLVVRTDPNHPQSPQQRYRLA